MLQATTSASLVPEEGVPPVQPAVLQNLKSSIETLTSLAERDDVKLAVLQELNEHFEIILTTKQQAVIVDSLLRVFLKLLQETTPQFIGESNTQLRKLMLEMMHRMPCNEHLKQYSKIITSLLFKLVEVENEENVLVCLRILIEHLKQFRSSFTFSPEVRNFINFVKNIYHQLPQRVNDIFVKPQFSVRDISELNMEACLAEAFTVSSVSTEQKLNDGSSVVYTLLPRGSMSLKVLAELPISVVLLYQLYKQDVQQDLVDFIPLVLNAIVMHPQRDDYSQEIFLDFLSAQIKTLSFLAYIVRIYPEHVAVHAQVLVSGVLKMMANCPAEAANLRKELLIASRHILLTELRSKFIPVIPQLFDEKLLLGSGYTAYESLRALACSTLADLVHHVRLQLPTETLVQSIYVFSRNVHDSALPCSMQTISCKLLLNLVECLIKSDVANARELLFQMMEVFVRKFKIIASEQLPMFAEKVEVAESVSVGAGSGQQSLQPVSADAPSTSSVPQSSSSQSLDAVAVASSSSATAATLETGPGPSLPAAPDDVTKATVSFEVGSLETDNSKLNVSSITNPVADKDETKFQYGFPNSCAAYSLPDCRALVKTLVCGAKTIAWGLNSVNAADATFSQQKFLLPKETDLFHRLLKYGLKALEIYTFTNGSQPNTYQRSLSTSSVRTKEEKEVLDHFAGIFTLMNIQNFKEVISVNIELIVQRSFENYALQVIPNSFLANSAVTSAFATILIEYLLGKMEEMGTNPERSNLYLKLFKLLFGSVQVFPQENEQMLKPHLHRLVNKSMELALVTKEPYNYFLLLRALFRSIGGGAHDLLYQEFLPLLPSLLQSLNSLQSGKHRQQMKELFVELCLTVPVRLSSLLPYLPMLMDPLVSALYGSPSLVSQGLRTLELCVDNLQPDFLYEHIAPVRAPLMEALWRTVSTGSEQTAAVAFRILGKFGGSNRKMLMEPPKLTYHLEPTDVPTVPLVLLASSTNQPSAVTATSTTTSSERPQLIELPLGKAVEFAAKTLKSSDSDVKLRRNCWKFLKSVLFACANNVNIDHVLGSVISTGSETQRLSVLLSPEKVQASFSSLDLETFGTAFQEEFSDRSLVLPLGIIDEEQQQYRCTDIATRKVILNCLVGILSAVATKDLRNDVLPVFTAIVRHITLLSIKQSIGSNVPKEYEYYKLSFMDSLVLVDAIAVLLGSEEKELSKAAVLSISAMLETATLIMGSKESACDLPIFRCLAVQISSLCFRDAWYCKLGGCIGIKSMLEQFSRSWLLRHATRFFKAFLFTMNDLVVEISNGCIEMARANLLLLLKRILVPVSSTVGDSSCSTIAPAGPVIADTVGEPLKAEQSPADQKYESVLQDICRLCIQNVASSSCFLRQESVSVLEYISETTGRPLGVLLLPIAEELRKQMIPSNSLKELSLNAQKGCLEAFAYGMSIKPSLVAFDVDSGPQKDAHTKFFEEVAQLCDTDEATLLKSFHVNFKGVQLCEVLTLKGEALKALFACRDCKVCRERIFNLMFKSLTSNTPELQNAAYHCMEKYLSQIQPDSDMVRQLMRPVLLSLGDPKNVNIGLAQKLSNLTRVFPTMFNEKLCDPLLGHLRKCFESATLSHQTQNKGLDRFVTQDMELCAVLIETFHQMPATPSRFVEALIPLIAHTEAAMYIDKGSNFRLPLLKLALRYPAETVSYCLQENSIKEGCVLNLFGWILKHQNGKVFRDYLRSNSHVILGLLKGNVLNGQSMSLSTQIPAERLQSLGVQITGILAKEDINWLMLCGELRSTIRQLWTNHDFRNHLFADGLDEAKWKTPKILVRCLLVEFKQDPDKIDLLFDIMYCFAGRYLTNFQFVKNFLEKEVALHYNVEWKRRAFLEFMNNVYVDPNKSVEFNTKVLQHLIIPCVQNSFESGEAETLVGTAPAPEQDSDDNIISVFLRRAIFNCSNQQVPDSLKILLTELCCLFVEYTPAHIHEASSKKQGSRLHQMMLFAWPSLQQNLSIDPTTRFHGHLLIAHIIGKFPINRQIVLQVFHSLLKAHHQEAKPVIKQALNVLTPAVLQRMDDGHTKLLQIARRLLIEEGHSVSQLIHLLQIIVRHYKVYYPVRMQLMYQIISAMQRLGLVSQAVGNDNRKLSVDLAEVIIKWELQRVAGLQQNTEQQQSQQSKAASSPDENAPMEKIHSDQVVNFLVRLACQPADQSSQAATVAAAEALCRRCFQLLKTALKTEMWGNTVELKFSWMEKLLLAAEQASNVSPICSVLDVLTYLSGVLPQDRIYDTLRPLQTPLSTCLNHSSNKVLKSLYSLLTKLQTVLTSEGAAGHSLEELETLCASILKSIYEGLANYEKHQTSSPQQLYPSLTLLKAVSLNQPAFIERNHLLAPFLKVVQKLAKEHVASVGLGTVADNNQSLADLVVMSLVLAEICVPKMTLPEHRKHFVQVLHLLIDKSTNPKVIEQIIKITDDWARKFDFFSSTGSSTPAAFQKETHHLLVKLMNCLEKRFSDRADLLSQFLETVVFVYKSPALNGTELTAKLEPAFMAGLRTSNVELRKRFFEIYNESIQFRPHSRLHYIISIQNWETMGQYYWIKQCVELLRALFANEKPVTILKGSKFPTLLSKFKMDQQGDAFKFGSVMDVKMDIDSDDTPIAEDGSSESLQSKQLIKMEHTSVMAFESSMLSELLDPLIELCYVNNDLAATVFIDFVSRLWSVMSTDQRELLANEVNPFLISGVHLATQQCQPTVVQTFIEAFSKCEPLIAFKAPVLRYLAPAQSAWHRCLLLLEQLAGSELTTAARPIQEREQSGGSFESVAAADKREVLDSLAECYSALNENDLWALVWSRRAKYPETCQAIFYEQMCQHEKVQQTLEKAMAKMQRELATANSSSVQLLPEFKLWEDHWVRCCEELNQWDVLKDFGTLKAISDPFLLIDAAWRIPNWPLMKEALSQVENNCPKEMLWKVYLYKGYLSICYPEDQHGNNIEKFSEQASATAIKDWRKLPSIITNSHVPILQVAQLIMELHEAAQVQSALHPAVSQQQQQAKSSGTQDLKALIKTWKNRHPTISDSLLHWNSVLTWRQHLFHSIITSFEVSAGQTDLQSQHSLLGIHSAAQTMTQFAKIAQKHGLTNAAIDALQRLHTIPNLPIVNCYQKLRQQVKCLIRSAVAGRPTEQRDIQKAVELLDQANLTYFNKEYNAELLTLKGCALSALGRSEEAVKSFSVALQLNENYHKAWASWGEHLDACYSKEKSIDTAELAMVCFLQTARHQSELKVRRYVGRALWLLKQEETSGRLNETFAKYAAAVPATNFVCWAPQFLSHVEATKSEPVATSVLHMLARSHPQSVFYRALMKSKNSLETGMELNDSSEAPKPTVRELFEGVITAMSDYNAVTTLALKRILDELSSFREHCSEFALRMSRELLSACYNASFEQRSDISGNIPEPIAERISKMLDELPEKCSSDTERSLVKRMKDEFDWSKPASKGLFNVCHKLSEWIRVWEAKVKLLPRSFLLQDQSHYLSSFSSKVADVELPGELLIPKLLPYCIRIAKFLPHVECVDKFGISARRIVVRGHNGKKYHYVIVRYTNDKQPSRFEKIFQLLRMLNAVFVKQPETACRFLQYSVLQQITINNGLLLIADNPFSVDMLKILEEKCILSGKRGADDMVEFYYKKLMENRRDQPSHQLMKDIFLEAQKTVQTNALTTWAERRFTDAITYFIFRKQFSASLSLISVAEYAFFLSRIDPDNLLLPLQTGVLMCHSLHFDFNSETELLDANRPVPFRLTPCFAEFLGPCVKGIASPSMTAAVRVLCKANLPALLRPILWDDYMEHLSSVSRHRTTDQVQTVVVKAVNTIMNRIIAISNVESGESKIPIAVAHNVDNLCRMDPKYHPWF